MTIIQKRQVAYLREKGESYAAIATTIGASENTVKSYCRRNGLGSDAVAQRKHASGETCGCCGESLHHMPGAKKKRFCSDRCRMKWWAKHPEAVRRKAIYQFFCATCGKPFESYGNSHRRYCSRACYGLARRHNNG
jgi:endogenous inhibitor of DNA gyrase (YacG/DUF329 family)